MGALYPGVSLVCGNPGIQIGQHFRIMLVDRETLPGKEQGFLQRQVDFIRVFQCNEARCGCRRNEGMNCAVDHGIGRFFVVFKGVDFCSGKHLGRQALRDRALDHANENLAVVQVLDAGEIFGQFLNLTLRPRFGVIDMPDAMMSISFFSRAGISLSH